MFETFWDWVIFIVAAIFALSLMQGIYSLIKMVFSSLDDTDRRGELTEAQRQLKETQKLLDEIDEYQDKQKQERIKKYGTPY